VTHDKSQIVIRQMRSIDIPLIIELQKRVFPGMPTWAENELAHHLVVFPEGQLVATDETEQILGSASSLIIDWDDYSEDAKWSTITGHGSFDTHNPLGKTLYGADMGVDPSAHRRGIGSMFYETRKKMVRERGLKRLLTGGRIPGYAQVSSDMTPMEYVAEVIRGKQKDPTLSFQLANGMVVLDVVPAYLEDWQSRGFATLLEWLNPEYVAATSLQTSDQIDAFGVHTEEPAVVQPRSSSHQPIRGICHAGRIFCPQRERISLPVRSVPRIFFDAAAEFLAGPESCSSRAPLGATDSGI
jgi:predicted N-acetyltransferase YhbS